MEMRVSTAALMLAVAACGDSSSSTKDAATDASPYRVTSPFTPLICTGGTPGDATCPYNFADLGPELGDAQLRFIAQPLSQDLYLQQITLIPGTPVNVTSIAFVVIDDSGNVSVTGATFTLDGTPIPQMVFVSFNATMKMALLYEVPQ